MSPTRRVFLGALLSAAPRLRLSMCNDAFRGWTFPDMLRAVKSAGYDAVELAPSTLSGDAIKLRRQMSSEGLEYAGLHNLLVSPEGLHATTADAAVRRRTWDRLARLVNLSATLGPHSLLVFGSGKQRAALRGTTVADATARLRDGLAELAPAARAAGVTILLEPLAPRSSNVVNTLAEAVAVVKAVNSPAVMAMFDTHNTVAEKQPAGDLIRRYAGYIRHVHVNEMDGRRPGAGDYDFRPVLQALKDTGYGGLVSVEVFDFAGGPVKIANDSAQFLRRLEAGIRKPL